MTGLQAAIVSGSALIVIIALLRAALRRLHRNLTLFLLVLHEGESAAAQQQHRQAGRHRLHPFLHSVILLFHRDYRSFPLCTAGEHAVHVVRCCLVQCGG